MKINGPRDLPDFRLWLIEQWKPDVGMFDAVEQLHRDVGAVAIDDGSANPALDAEVARRALPPAALWWVSPDMAALVDKASRSLLATTLTDDLMPDRHGLAVFAEPLVGMSADTGKPLNIEAISWTQGIYLDGPRVVTALAITTYRHIAKGEICMNAVVDHPGPNTVAVRFGNRTVNVVRGPMDDDIWLPAGQSNWPYGLDVEAPSAVDFALDELRLASMSEDRRWLAALWLLASQPLAESTVHRAERPAARRSKRAAVSSDVRLVNVRRRVTQGEQGPRTPGDGGRTYHQRWVVEGFWRQQACGPQWKDHRPVFVESHVRGPKDKPLVVRETVKVLRGDQ